MDGAALFEPTRGRKVRCRVCGATGYDSIVPATGQPMWRMSWQWTHLRGHAPATCCGKVLSVLRNGKARRHTRVPEQCTPARGRVNVPTGPPPVAPLQEDATPPQEVAPVTSYDTTPTIPPRLGPWSEAASAGADEYERLFIAHQEWVARNVPAPEERPPARHDHSGRVPCGLCEHRISEAEADRDWPMMRPAGVW